jgi:HlyD family secretion protein
MTHPSGNGAVGTSNRRWLVGGAVVIVLVGIGVVGFRRGESLQYFGAAVERGDIRDAVDLTGTVNAVVTVQVGSQVSGTIARLNADFNSRVRRGDIVALIDPSILNGAVLQATADLENGRANVTAAEANLAKARAQADQAQRDYRRIATLAKSNVSTEQELETVRAADAGARASVDAAAANVAQAKAAVSQKIAALAVARTNLEHTIIRSPIDGIVVARNVDVGQTVAASLQAPTIFTIAQDLTKMQLYAKTQESDVGRIRVGQPASFSVDAFPKETFHGVVSQIRMNPTTIQNVVTYDAIVDFENPERKLFPGMTAYASIPIATVHNVVKVPNGGLRYKPQLPSDEVRALYARERIPDPGAVAAETDSGGHVSPVARETAVVWKLLPDRTITPVQVQVGLTDHAFTEVVSVLHGALSSGDEVVTGSLLSKGQPPGAPAIRR